MKETYVIQWPLSTEATIPIWPNIFAATTMNYISVFTSLSSPPKTISLNVATISWQIGWAC